MKSPNLAIVALVSALLMPLTACNDEVRYFAYSSIRHNAMLDGPSYIAPVPLSVQGESQDYIRTITSTPMSPSAPEPTITHSPSNLMPNFMRQAINSSEEMPFMTSFRFDYGLQGQCIMLCGVDEVLLMGTGILQVDIDRQTVELTDIYLTSADNNFNLAIDALTGRLDHSITADVTGGELTQADLMRVAQFDSTGNFPFTGYDPNTDEVIAEGIVFNVQSTTPSGAALGFIFASGTPITN